MLRTVFTAHAYSISARAEHSLLHSTEARSYHTGMHSSRHLPLVVPDVRRCKHALGNAGKLPAHHPDVIRPAFLRFRILISGVVFFRSIGHLRLRFGRPGLGFSIKLTIPFLEGAPAGLVPRLCCILIENGWLPRLLLPRLW